MSLLDTTIGGKLLEEIIETFDPIHQHILEIEVPGLLGKILYKSRYSLSLLPVLIWQNTYNPEFKTNIQKIKLNYYKRNLALLEILAERQDLPTNISLAFNIIRENLSLKHNSEYTNIYQWYRTYKTEQVIQHPPESFLLYERHI